MFLQSSGAAESSVTSTRVCYEMGARTAPSFSLGWAQGEHPPGEDLGLGGGGRGGWTHVHTHTHPQPSISSHSSSPHTLGIL